MKIHIRAAAGSLALSLPRGPGVSERIIITVPGRLLGQYEGAQDVVTLKRVRDKLMADDTNLPTSEWQPESESTFSDGQGHVQVREHL